MKDTCLGMREDLVDRRVPTIYRDRTPGLMPPEAIEGLFSTYLGSLSSPTAYGAPGMGSTLFMVDPEWDLTFVCLTLGLLEESYSVERFQRLCDLVQSAAE